MSDIKILPAAETQKMLGRFSTYSIEAENITRKYLDVPYGPADRQKVDIYLPDEGDGPFPAVLFLHGGGWEFGRKSDGQILPFMPGLGRGYAVVAVGYRLMPEIKYPENVFDVKALLRWIAEHGAAYHLDSSRVILTGASAGAHLAMVAAFTHGQPAFEGASVSKTSRVVAVVEQYGPTDFLRQHAQYDESGYPRSYTPGDVSSIDRLLGVRAEDVPNLMHFVSPIHLVHRDIPPILIQHGRHDPVIPYQQATELYEKICALCGPDRSVLDISETLTHADPGYADDESVATIFGFLDRVVPGK
jgi:acetyl esterase/lipase